MDRYLVNYSYTKRLKWWGRWAILNLDNGVGQKSSTKGCFVPKIDTAN